MVDVVWNVTEEAANKGASEETASCSARVTQRSVCRDVNSTRISAPKKIFNKIVRNKDLRLLGLFKEALKRSRIVVCS